MKQFEILLKILLYGTRIFPLTPIKISEKTIKISKTLKWIYFISLFGFTAFLLYINAAGIGQTELRSDPYLFLGHGRFFFLSACPFSMCVIILIKVDHIVSGIQILMNLQDELKFGTKKWRKMIFFVFFELFYLYSTYGTWCFVLYSTKVKNIILRIVIALTNGMLITSIIVFEIFYLNCITLIGDYIKMINEKLLITVKSSVKIVPLIR